MKWYKPGLGEVHNEDHSQMIYCEDADGIVDNELAERVCELLNSEAQTAVEPVAWRYHCEGDPLKWYFSETPSLLGLYEPLYAAPTTQAPAPNALDAETAIKNCLEAGETMRVLKRVVNLLLESRRNLGPEDHELRDRIDQLFRPDAAIAAQSAQEKVGGR